MTYQFGILKKVHEDERRTISEFNGDEMSVQSFMVHRSGLPLGKHYHEHKTETFIVTDGGGYVLLCDVSGKSSVATRVTLQKGSVVVIEPFVAHTFYLQPETQMVCVSSEQFNPLNPDIHSADWLV